MDITDSHTHLDSKEFDEDRAAVIERARAAGVTRMLTIGTGNGLDGAGRAIALAEEYPFIWASAGVHPHNAADDIDAALFEKLASHPKVVAIGETGLDFYRDWAPVDKQYECFQMQIDVAKQVKKPLIIHSRQAGEQSFKLLHERTARDVGGVFHCFAENAEFAARLWDMGFYVSFPGLLTFKKAQEVRDICAAIPLEQILIETDAPFLAPEPHRGKRCEPAFVVQTAKRLAEIKGLSLEEVAAITTANTLKLFSHMR
jgi:TatD DNase family protein